MGVNELCSRCQLLCQSRLIQVDPDFLFGTYSASSRHFLFQLPNTSFVWPKRPVHRWDVVRSFWESQKTLKEGISRAPVISDYSVNTLQDGIAAGCHLCSLLHDEYVSEYARKVGAHSCPSLGVPILHVFTDQGLPRPNDTIEAHPRLSIYSLDKEFSHGNEYPAGYAGVYHPISLMGTRVDAISCLREPIISTTDDRIHGFRKRAVDWVRGWIHECRESHVACKELLCSALDGGSLRPPTRLLEIGMQAGQFLVKLIDSRPLSGEGRFKGPYAALSHCWGVQGVSMQLTVSTISDYRNDIPFKDIPLTFREAIIFTYLLGIRYLWIDALCIIQDDERDWHREVPQMYGVYAGAEINIAASASSDCHGGLLVQNYLLTPCHIDTVWDPSMSSLKLAVGTDYKDFLRNVASAPLYRRAWVFQERILSRRTIHFAKDQIWLHCLDSRHAECLANGANPTSLSNIDIQGCDWASLVGEFSKTWLTRQSDRLAAISGVAQAYLNSRNLQAEDYVAGLLWPEILNGLCWSVDYDRHEFRHRDCARSGIAPTWSWASTCSGTRIVWKTYESSSGELESQPDFHILDLIRPAEAGGPFDAVQKGVLRIIGSISSVHVLKAQGTSDASEIDSTKTRVTLDDKSCLREDISFTILLVKMRPKSFFDPPGRKHGTFDKFVYSGILLEKVPSKRGTYQRVGWVENWISDMEDVGSEHVFVVRTPSYDTYWWTKSVEIEPDNFLEKRGNRSYIIDIV